MCILLVGILVSGGLFLLSELDDSRRVVKVVYFMMLDDVERGRNPQMHALI
jgi:hypothetical protein